MFRSYTTIFREYLKCFLKVAKSIYYLLWRHVCVGHVQLVGHLYIHTFARKNENNENNKIMNYLELKGTAVTCFHDENKCKLKLYEAVLNDDKRIAFP